MMKAGQRRKWSGGWCAALAATMVLFVPSGVKAQGATATATPAAQTSAPAAAPVEAKWLALFEQSYGTEGLYVIEVAPKDAGAKSRLNLQIINAAAQQFRLRHPKEIPSFQKLQERGLVKDIQPAPNEEYRWDDKTKLFTSSLGGLHTPQAGARFLLRGNEAIRSRLFNPDRFTRQRWKKLYQDPQTPELIKREIQLREFMLENYYFPEAANVERVKEHLRIINDAAGFYALQRQMKPGDPVKVGELYDAGLLDTLGDAVPGTSITLTAIGTPPVAIRNGRTITLAGNEVEEVRLERAKAVYAKYKDYPPALALSARFQPPDRSIRTINRAIELWPDVPGLRVERLGHLARQKNFKAWTPDLDYLLKRFPAAPLLIEIELAGQVGEFQKSPVIQAQLATMLSDVRPDLLTHQLWAIRTLEKAEDIEAARTVYDRLVFANPAWGALLDRP